MKHISSRTIFSRILTFLLVLSVLHEPASHAGLLEQDVLRVTNLSEQDIYLCFYHQRGTSGTRASSPIYLPAKNNVASTIPPVKFAAQRTLVCNNTPRFPHHYSIKKNPFLTPPLGVGWWHSHDITFYTGTDGAMLTPTDQWNEYTTHRHAYQSYVEQFPHHAETAIIHNTTTPSENVATFLDKRLTHTHKALSQFLETQLESPLRIGICVSGGGFRAMIATVGLLHGLDRIGLLNCILSIATLSGSTWALATWIAEKTAIELFRNALSMRLSQGIMHSLNEQYQAYLHIKANKKLCKLPMSVIDFYGLSLSYTLLKPAHTDHTKLTLSSLQDMLDPTRHPFPLFTAATRFEDPAYRWLLFTPYTISLIPEDKGIPTWALGRTFHAGSSVNNSPEPMLGYFFGMFGSSFSVSIRDALERGPSFLQKTIQSLFSEKIHHKILSAPWANQKLSPATLPNPFFGSNALPGNTESMISIVDGGYKNNLPLFPLVHHHRGELDVIILLDNRRNTDEIIKDVIHGVREVQRAGYSLPQIDPEQVADNSFSIFPATHKGEPTVIALTLNPDSTAPTPCNPIHELCYATPNFSYTQETFHRLAELVSHVITTHVNALREALYHATQN